MSVARAIWRARARTERGESGIAEFGLSVQDGKRRAIGDEQRGSPRHVKRAQSGDERGHSQLRNQQAVDGPHQDAAEDGRHNHQPGMKVDHDAKRAQHQAAVDQSTGNDGRQPGHRTHRQIDASCQDHEGHAHRQDGVNGNVLHQDGKVTAGEKGRRHGGESRHQRDEHNQRAQAKQEGGG